MPSEAEKLSDAASFAAPKRSLKFQIIPFRARHLSLIAPIVSPEMLELGRSAEQTGRGFTACLLGNPIGAAGVAIQRPGLGEAWALFSPLIRSRKLELYRAVASGLKEIIQETRIKKIYAVIQPNDEAAVRFIEHLGFKLSGHLYEKFL